MWQFAMNYPGNGNYRIGLARGRGDIRWVNRLLTVACFMTIAGLHVLVLSGFDFFEKQEKPFTETRELSLTLDLADPVLEAVEELIREAAPELPLPTPPVPREEPSLPEPVLEEIPVLQEESSMASLLEPETALSEAASFSAPAEDTSVHIGNGAASEPASIPVTRAVSVPPKTMTDAEYLALIMGRLEKNKIYPLAVRKRGIEGDITVHFTIRQDGTVSDLRLADPSGHRFLAQAAFETIRSASPFPIMEGWDRDYTARVNIRYRLEDQTNSKN